jgi:hypothetical protein
VQTFSNTGKTTVIQIAILEKLVKRRSNTGQMLANFGQILVKRHSNAIQTLAKHWPNTGQKLVRNRSKTSQTLVKNGQTLIKTLDKPEASLSLGDKLVSSQLEK